MDSWIPLSEALEGVRALAQSREYERITGADAESLLFRRLPADEYHADRHALSCSLLKPMLLSPAHFQAALVAQPKESAERDFGSLVHVLLLEPHLAGEELAVYPGVVGTRDLDFKTFEARNAHKLVVDEPTFALAFRLASKISETRYKGRPLAWYIEEAMCEASIYFTEPVTGLRLRTRLDAFHPDVPSI